jgi:hypothetical protein
MVDDGDEAPRSELRLPLWPRLAILLFAAPVGVLCAASDPGTGARQVPLLLVAAGLLVLALVYLWLTAPHTPARWQAAWYRGYWLRPNPLRRSAGPTGRRGRPFGKPKRAAMARRSRRRLRSRP